MTTVVYHNNILAADTRTTRHGNEDCTCRHCGKEAALVRDNRAKVHLVNNNCVFMGERILAVGTAGDVVTIDRLLETMRTSPDLQAALENFYQLSHNPTLLRCRLILVTPASVFMIETAEPKSSKGKKHGVNYKKFQRDATVGIGSGEMAAVAAIKVYGESAIDAISVAAAVDELTGGTNINYIDFAAEKLEVAKAEMKSRKAPVPVEVTPPKKPTTRKQSGKKA